jgi:hypothetical protein
MAGTGIVDISELTFALYSSVYIVPLYFGCVVISFCQFFLKHFIVLFFSCEAKWPSARA